MYGFKPNITTNQSLNGFATRDSFLITKTTQGFESNYIYYAKQSGNINSLSTWMCNGFQAQRLPSLYDTIVIPEGYTLTINTNITILNILSNGSILFDSTARTLTVNGSCIIKGTLNMSTSNAAHNLVLRGEINRINGNLFTTGTNSTITFGRNGVQNILNITYRTLDLTSSSGFTKTLLGDTICSYLVCQTANTILNGYSIEINGNVGFLFIGIINSNVILSTTSKTFSYNGITFNGTVLIKDGITITTTATETITFTNVLNGNSASDTFVNKTTINYQSATAPMLTGILNCNSAANTFKYNQSGNQDVTAGTYRTLEFGGSGVKTLLGNIVVNVTAGGSWSITGTATINYNGFTITTI